MKMKALLTAAAVAGVAALNVPSALAEVIYGLTSSQQIVRFNSANPGAVTSTSAAISGIAAGDRIVDIDVYPVNGLMHGIGASGMLYRINPLTGAATLDVSPQASMGTVQDADFNPAADRMRVSSAGNANYRITPSVNTAGPTGANAGLVSVDGFYAFASGGAPDIVANAYNNNFDGTAGTTLFSIDTSTDSLISHSGAPQFNTVATVGALGTNVGRLVGFDVSGTGAAFVSDGNSLYGINLTTGALSGLGLIGTALQVESIAAAVAPEPASLALLGLAAMWIRRRG